MPVMMIPSEYTQVGRVCTQGQAAMKVGFDLLNTGNANLAYTTAVSYKSGSNWLSVTPWAGSPANLAAGGSQRFTIAFNNSGLPPGTYEATIRLAATNTPVPTPSFQEVKVSLIVQPQEVSFPCDDIPLYAREATNPAVLILLDLSDSMKEKIDTIPPDYEFPRTPDLSEIVQEIVNIDGWKPGNAMAFYLTRAGGDSLRKPRAYDGYSGTAPLLHLEYNDEYGEHVADVRVKQSSDDAYMTDSSLFFTATQNLELSNEGENGLALRFQKLDLQPKAVITRAYIVFTPSESGSGDLISPTMSPARIMSTSWKAG
jgi:hypothetical protein